MISFLSYSNALCIAGFNNRCIRSLPDHVEVVFATRSQLTLNGTGDVTAFCERIWTRSCCVGNLNSITSSNLLNIAGSISETRLVAAIVTIPSFSWNPSSSPNNEDTISTTSPRTL